MNIRICSVIVAVWLLGSSSLNAQVELSLPYVNNAAPGSVKNLPVRVANFDSIVSMQFVIRWNPAIIKYTGIDGFGTLPNLGLTNFNATKAVDSGYVRVLWEGPNAFPGVTLPDGSSIFRLKYDVIGPDTSSTPVKFTEITYSFPFTEFEIVKVVAPDGTLAAFSEQDCRLVNGFVAVGYTVSADEPNDGEFEMQVAPNPFSDKTTASFSLDRTSDVQVTVTDLAGRVIHQRSLSGLNSGTHQLTFGREIFPAKGAYFLTIQAGSQTTVRPLSFQ
ncbi:MAG: hypothetical protein RL013_1588 [Bacteroidota bacterium]|jgi:hypothetical protein